MQAADDVGGPAGGCDPDDGVVLCEAERGEILGGEGEGVLGSFDGAEHGVDPAREQADHHTVRGAEGRAAFDGIEHAEPAGGPRAEVDEAAVRGEGIGGGCGDRGDGGEGGVHGVGDGAVGGVDEGDDALWGEGVDVFRIRIDALGFKRGEIFMRHRKSCLSV